MTVITFAKQRTFLTNFGCAKTQQRKLQLAFGEIINPLFISAIISIISLLIIVIFGIQTTRLILLMSKQSKQIVTISKQVEELRIEALKLDNPQYIIERAKMLKLISAKEANYLTFDALPEFALGQELLVETK